MASGHSALPECHCDSTPAESRVALGCTEDSHSPTAHGALFFVPLLREPLLLGRPWPGAAQFGPGVNVFDAANFGQNTISAIQNVITAVNMVLSVANQVLELTPLEEILIAGAIVEDLALIGQLLEDAQGLIQDIETMQALFNPKEIPTTLPAMRQRLTAMEEAIYNARSYALKAQRLVTTLLSAVRHLIALVEGIQALTGNMSSNQTLLQVEATISTTLTTLTLQAASHQRSETLDRLRHQVVLEMDRAITRQYWSVWFAVDE